MPEVHLYTKQDEWSHKAAVLARMVLGDGVSVFQGAWGMPLPEPPAAAGVILSFLSPWIIPRRLLDAAELAINFHPGPANYPGIGCYNFALYEEAATYGVVCHHMAPRVDTGGIVEERLFDVYSDDTVESLKLRSMVTMLALFHDVLQRIRAGGREFPAVKDWTRRPFTRRELNALGEVSADMPAEEIRRRVRAMAYPGFPGARVQLGGIAFFAPVPNPA